MATQADAIFQICCGRRYPSSSVVQGVFLVGFPALRIKKLPRRRIQHVIMAQLYDKGISTSRFHCSVFFARLHGPLLSGKDWLALYNGYSQSYAGER